MKLTWLKDVSVSQKFSHMIREDVRNLILGYPSLKNKNFGTFLGEIHRINPEILGYPRIPGYPLTPSLELKMISIRNHKTIYHSKWFIWNNHILVQLLWLVHYFFKKTSALHFGDNISSASALHFLVNYQPLYSMYFIIIITSFKYIWNMDRELE